MAGPSRTRFRDTRAGVRCLSIRVSANSYLYSMVSKPDLCDISDMANKLHLHDGLGQQLYDPGLLQCETLVVPGTVLPR